MEPLQLLLFLVLIGLILLLCYFIWWTKNLAKPKPGKDCTKSGLAWNDSCSYMNEISYDPSISSPKGLSPYIISFSYSGSAGKPLYLPMWYRFRYVDGNTGGYSDFSEWTKSPVISGSCCMPCPGGVGSCGTAVPQGGSTCSFNRPVIGISVDDSLYTPFIPQNGKSIYINVHRYTGKTYSDITPPADTAEDEIIGFMISGFYYEGVNYYGVVDVLNNPCTASTTCEKPSWCTKQSLCDANACSTYK